MKLTQDLTGEEHNAATASSLALSNKDLHEVSGLRAYVNLVRLDLSHNRIQSIEALSRCNSLKWLSVARNNLKSLKGIESLSNLMVFNGSSNQITSIKEVEGLIELRALIVNDNQIKSICKLEKLMALNTLVLSKNPILSIGNSLGKVSSLIKLSLSSCELHDLGSLKSLIDLKELRLAQNKIKHLSKDLSKNTQLQIIDLGSNSLNELSNIEVLSTIPFLKNLNLRGNPLCLQNNYEDEVKTLLPNLRLLDGHRVESSCKKRHSEDQSVLSSTSKLNKEQEREGLHTSKKSRRDGADQAESTVTDENIQISNDSLHAIKRRERLQNVKKAVKDLKGKSHDKEIKQAVQSVASESYDNKPFIEFLGQEEPVAKEPPCREQDKKKDRSGLVSIIHNQRMVSKHKKSKHRAETLSISMEEVEVGAGGASSWD